MYVICFYFFTAIPPQFYAVIKVNTITQISPFQEEFLFHVLVFYEKMLTMIDYLNHF